MCERASPSGGQCTKCIIVLTPRTKAEAPFGGPSEIVQLFYSGHSTDWLNQRMRCPSAQERAPENLAEGLGLRAFVRAAPVLTKVTSAAPETHQQGPTLTPPA